MNANLEAATPPDIFTTFVGTLNAIAQQEADAKNAVREAKANDVRGVIMPRLEDARALIADIEAAQKEAAPVVKPFAGMDWSALRKRVPVSIHGDTDTRGYITMLERAFRDADELLGARNATTLRGTVARIEQLQQFDSLTVPHELLGQLEYEMGGSADLAAGLRQKAREVAHFATRLQEDITSGKGVVQEQAPPVEQIAIPTLPELKEPATRAVTEFDPLNYEQETQRKPKDDITAGPYFKVRAPKERNR